MNWSNTALAFLYYLGPSDDVEGQIASCLLNGVVEVWDCADYAATKPLLSIEPTPSTDAAGKSKSKATMITIAVIRESKG